MDNFVIETKRLRLRRWKDTDIEPFTRINTDPRVMEYFPSTFDAVQTEQIIRKQEDSFETRGFGLWACELKESNTFIGFTGLSSPSFESSFTPCIEIGWRLAFEHWGKGYAPEAAKAVLHFAFDQLRLKEVLSWTAVNNLQSRRVMEKIGMQQDLTGDFEHPNIPAGHKLRPHVLYRIQADVFAALNSKVLIQP